MTRQTLKHMMISLLNVPSSLLIVGWEDSCVRAYDLSSGLLLWELARAHRGSITSLAVGPAYFVTGSSDGGVSVWSSTTREFICQFHEHQRPVTGLQVDLVQPHLIHSCSLDKSVLTYDLKLERRSVRHDESPSRGRGLGFLSLSQRRNHELELVTSGADGRVLFWDCDLPEHVESIAGSSSNSGSSKSQVVISPSGKFLVTVSDLAQVSLYDIQRPGHATRLAVCQAGHSKSIAGVCWSPDERQVISVGQDCCICIWNFYA